MKTSRRWYRPTLEELEAEAWQWARSFGVFSYPWDVIVGTVTE